MTGLIILAAGSSSRLGQPKQNLVYKHQTLLQRAIETADASICHPIVVVLGGNAGLIEPTLADITVNIVHNTDWQEGMASSIRLGIAELKNKEPNLRSIVLMLCDQPFVDTCLLNLLVLSKTKDGIVACSYKDDLIGVPALFDAVYIPELLALQGQEGAKKLLVKYARIITEIPFPQGLIDIDTHEDFEKLKGSPR
jgi:molybdenum cofactor cytidylyltransferase